MVQKRAGVPAGPLTVSTAFGSYTFDDGAPTNVSYIWAYRALIQHPLLQPAGGSATFSPEKTLMPLFAATNGTEREGTILTKGSDGFAFEDPKTGADVWVAVGFRDPLQTGSTNAADDDARLFVYAGDGERFSALQWGAAHTSATGQLRDPSIYVKEDTREFFVCATTGAYPTETGTLPKFTVYQSDDLNTWTDAFVVDMNAKGLSGVTHIWAPDWFEDVDGSLWLLVSVSFDNAGTFRPYALRVNNLDTGSVGNAVSINCPRTGMVIDPVINRTDDGAYHLFIKQQIGPGGYIEHYRSTTGPFSGYTAAHIDNTLGTGDHSEGPQTVKLEDGTWFVAWDYDTAGEPSYLIMDALMANVIQAPRRLYFENGVRHAGYLRTRKQWIRDLVLRTSFARSTSAVTNDDGVWHYIGDPGEPPFLNGFSRFFPDDRNLWPRFRRRGDHVQVMGWIKLPGSFPASGTTMFNLPEGFHCPPGFFRYLTACDDKFAVYDMAGNGDVNFHIAPGANPNSYMSLSAVFGGADI